jgi:hypothetical protein
MLTKQGIRPFAVEVFMRRVMNRILLLLGICALLFSFGSHAAVQTGQEPKWPQTFRLFAGEGAVTFGFPMTESGNVTVTASQTLGIPVRVELRRNPWAASPPIRSAILSGPGTSMTFAYPATSVDLQAGALWTVEITPAAPVAPPAPNAGAQQIALGTISVQHPGASIQTALQRHPAILKQLQPRQVINAATLNAQYQKELLDRRAADAAILKQNLGTAVQRQAPSNATTVPRIISMSVSQGQPGTLVTIHGDGFGSNYGKVHFIVNPGIDVQVNPDSWNNDLINVHVPDESGIQAYAGQMYLVLGSGIKVSPVPFQFNPDIVFLDFRPGWSDPNQQMDPTDMDFATSLHLQSIVRNGTGDFFGHRGDDLFYPRLVLKNGWVVHSVAGGVDDLMYPGHSGGYIVESRVGTPYPYVKFHWWMEAFTWPEENVIVIVKGPKGTTWY